MNLVFSVHDLPAKQRYDAWRAALCDHYVRVDTSCDSPDDYDGFIKEASFGAVTVTDCYLSAQKIVRHKSHLAHIDKDCFYLALTQRGSQLVEQHGKSIVYGVGNATLFSAAEPYTLKNYDPYRAIYLEFPRSALARRSASLDQLLATSIDLSQGMGRILGDVCASMVLESDALPEKARALMGEQVLDVLSMALECASSAQPVTGSSVQPARLRQIANYIDANAANPLLNPERIAKANQISVRALHYLFKSTGQSVSEYIWERRLARAREELELSGAAKRSVTEIALGAGFNSMSHFSSLFRRKFGMSPSELRGP